MKRPFFSPGLREEKTLKEMEKIVKNENFCASIFVGLEPVREGTD
uniref:Uncharacterized protein n=1 Tax=Meloidogyne enterolobii TaxID=390850 RepID=A0A6V7VU65_MELEN|nr:unnamed protein product [Meloidogyne enterolobii]